MHTRLVTIVSVSMLALAACGGGSGGPQGEVADLFVEVAEGEGLELDRECVEDATARLSDADAEAIVEAGPDGQPDISDEGNAIGDDVFGCVSADSFIDSMVAEMEGDESIDLDCLREQLEALESVEAIQDGLFDAMFSCTSDG